MLLKVFKVKRIRDENKKILQVLALLSVSLVLGSFSLFPKVVTSEETSEVYKENKTVAIMLERAKEDMEFTLEQMNDLPDNFPIIAIPSEYGGGFSTFCPEVNIDEIEPLVVEIGDDVDGIIYRDDNPSTVGEVREAIRSYNNG